MAVTTTEDSIVFACYARSCAPPPVGKGGSTKGGRKGGGVVRPSGGGDRQTKAGTSKSIAKSMTSRYATRGGEKVGTGTKLRTGSTSNRPDNFVAVGKKTGTTSYGGPSRKGGSNDYNSPKMKKWREYIDNPKGKAPKARAADKNPTGGIGGGGSGRAAAKAKGADILNRGGTRGVAERAAAVSKVTGPKYHPNGKRKAVGPGDVYRGDRGYIVLQRPGQSKAKAIMNATKKYETGLLANGVPEKDAKRLATAYRREFV